MTVIYPTDSIFCDLIYVLLLYEENIFSNVVS